MYYLTIVIGTILGVLLFLFLSIVVKRTGLYFLVPLITFAVAISMIVYSVMKDVGRVEEGFIGIGFLIAAVVCTLFLPAKFRASEKKPWTKIDVAGLIFLPCLLSMPFVLISI